MRDDLRGIWCIIEKDMKTYYSKPPAISWGIVFPITWVLAFYLRNPVDFEGLVPGLVAMTALFSTTAAEAVVINFELRLGSLERLLLAPISMMAILLGKILGGTVFGLFMSSAVAVICAILLNIHMDWASFFSILLPALLAFSAMGSLLCLMVREVFEAQTLLNLPRFVMVFLSGVIYPLEAMPRALQFVAHLLPLTYAVKGFKGASDLNQGAPMALQAMVLMAFFLLFLFPAVKLLSKKFE